jgi:hypothetical protein
MASYNLAALPSTAAPVSESISSRSRRDFQILRFLKLTKSANGAIDGSNIYLANYKLKSHSEDPRLYARNPYTYGFYPNTCLFDTETGNGYCIISMPTSSAAHKLLAAIMKSGTIEREVSVPIDLPQAPTAVNRQLQYSAVKDVVSLISAKEESAFQVLLKKCEALPKDEVDTMLELAAKIGAPCLKYMNEEYFKNFSLAMAMDASVEKRVFHFHCCKFLIQLDKHQYSTGKTDTELWPLVLIWQSEMEEAYEARFGAET